MRDFRRNLDDMTASNRRGNPSIVRLSDKSDRELQMIASPISGGVGRNQQAPPPGITTARSDGGLITKDNISVVETNVISRGQRPVVLPFDFVAVEAFKADHDAGLSALCLADCAEENVRLNPRYVSVYSALPELPNRPTGDRKAMIRRGR